jgi:PEP-CTERM/exosortase A-associated glycosyltransferase
MLETWALRRADQVTTICEGLRREILSRGVPGQRVTVIPNAVDIEGLRFGVPPAPALREKYGLDGKITLGFIGSFYRFEGLHLLVEAMGTLARTLPGVRLLLVGGGEQDQALRAQVEESGLQDRVIFTGRVPHDDIEQLYALVDILVYPRTAIRLTELVTPLKPLEAMAQGKLLIASDVGGHRELIRDGQTGALFAAGSVQALCDAVIRLVEQREVWDERRLRARAFVEHERNWALSVSHYQKVYAAALGSTLAAV